MSPTRNDASGETAPDLELRGVSKRFGDVLAVDGVELTIDHGEFISLLGPSGCGKTTTLRMIAGFERPDAGRVLIGGEDVTPFPAYKRDANTVFQTYALFPHLSVLDNVAYGLRQRGMSRRDRAEHARRMLALVRLPEIEQRKPRQLSGGQQQRVALARALVMEPRVLLLDEPLGALDLRVRKELQIELKRIQERVGITFVYVTHDQDEALAMSDRVAVMNRGRIEQIGTPSEIYDTPATPFVAEFIGDTNFIRRKGRTIAVRPERLRLERGANGAPNGLAGEIVTTMVVGPAVHCVVRAADGQELLVRLAREGGGAEALAQGERVTVSWADGSALVLGDATHRGGEGRERPQRFP